MPDSEGEARSEQMLDYEDTGEAILEGEDSTAQKCLCPLATRNSLQQSRGEINLPRSRGALGRP